MEILADGSCREVGEPRLVLDDARGGRFFVAGTFGAVQWFGWGGAAGYRHQVAVYNREDASCLLVVPTRWQVTSLALHPSGAYLAVGAGEYDGGLDFDGELLLIDLGSGQATSLLRRSRAVASLEWTSDESLRVTGPSCLWMTGWGSGVISSVRCMKSSSTGPPRLLMGWS